MALTADDAQRFAEVADEGGVVLYGADTVYGLACDPENAVAVARIAEIKGRPDGKPSAVQFFAVDAAGSVLDGLPAPVRQAAEALLPGPVTLLVPNPDHRFPLICGRDPETLGLRVPLLPAAAAALAEIERPVAQSSANRAGGAEARRLDDVDAGIRAAADLELNAGELRGIASTVVDLRPLAGGGRFAIVREGALGAEDVARRLR